MGATMDVHHHGLSQRFSKWLMLVCGAMRLVIDVLSGVGGYLLVGAGCIGPRELRSKREQKSTTFGRPRTCDLDPADTNDT